MIDRIRRWCYALYAHVCDIEQLPINPTPRPGTDFVWLHGFKGAFNDQYAIVAAVDFQHPNGAWRVTWHPHSLRYRTWFRHYVRQRYGVEVGVNTDEHTWIKWQHGRFERVESPHPETYNCRSSVHERLRLGLQPMIPAKPPAVHAVPWIPS